MNTPIPSVRAERPDLPPAVERVLAKLCAKDAKERPASMDEVIALLEPLRPRQMEPAPIAARAAAAALDLGIAAVVTAALGFALIMLGHWVGLTLDSDRFVKVVWAVVFPASQIVPEAWFGTTPGKRLFNLEVVRENGAHPGALALVFRFLLRWPGVLALVPTLPWQVAVAISLLQFVAIGAAGVAYFVLKGRTASEALTRRRVVYRRSPFVVPA